MNRHIHSGVFFLLLAVFCLRAGAEAPNILVINSYNTEYRWTSDQYDGIMQSLALQKSEYRLYTEYLDWKRFPDENQIRLQYEICRQKYLLQKIDVIITTDDRALQFAIDYRDELFSGAPIVFSGVYRESAANFLAGRKGITGVYEDIDPDGTIRQALRANPRVRHAYVISEMTESGRGTEKLILEAFARIAPELPVISLSDMNIEGIESYLALVPEDSMVLLGSYSIERDGRSWATDVFSHRISLASRVPVYTLFTHNFGTGTMGGSMLSGIESGRAAGTLALRILAGERAGDIEPSGQTNFLDAYDFSVMKRFGFKASDFPPHATFINRKASFFAQYRFESFLILATFILMTGFLTALVLQYHSIKRLAFTDRLTGLPNRTALFRHSGKLLADYGSGKKTAVLFMDIDNFKYINDTFGQDFGDRVLLEATALLRSLPGHPARGQTVRVARFGGDEFVILLSNVTHAEIEIFAENLHLLFGRKLSLDGRELYLTISSGIAVFPDHSDTVAGLLQNAEAAMHRAKSAGKIQYLFFDESMYLQLERWMDLANGLRTAIENGELEVVYQPQINLRSGRLEGLEALVRWKRPEKGYVSPGEFIPVAESTGQIETIGIFVLETAAAFIKQAAAAGLCDFSVSVNVSVKQMAMKGFTNQLIRVVQTSGISPERLTIEVTESVLMESIADVREKLGILRDAGFQIALDDFGKGYSSLTYLRTLPVHEIKMDKEFIDDMFVDERTRLLTCSIIRICHDLGLRLVAEGVENREQMLFLQSNGCDFIQGYYFSKPGSGEQVIRQLSLNFL